jgi:hypothetical protein
MNCDFKIFTGTSWGKESIRKCKEYGVGMVSTPKDPIQPDKIDNDIPVIWDNGAFHGGFNAYVWKITTEKIKRDIFFAVVPDVVGKANESLELSSYWIDEIPFKKYLALQDGMDFEMVYSLLSRCDGAFLGGSVDWKWDTMPYWRVKTKEIGLPLHAGRCNGLLQWDRAAFLGLNSCDGSTIIRHNMLDDVPRFYIHFREQQRWINLVKGIDGVGVL